jgi:hypothetical protein
MRLVNLCNYSNEIAYKLIFLLYVYAELNCIGAVDMRVIRPAYGLPG